MRFMKRRKADANTMMTRVILFSNIRYLSVTVPYDNKWHSSTHRLRLPQAKRYSTIATVVKRLFYYLPTHQRATGLPVGEWFHEPKALGAGCSPQHRIQRCHGLAHGAPQTVKVLITL